MGSSFFATAAMMLSRICALDNPVNTSLVLLIVYGSIVRTAAGF
jgi:hypothetical protein